MLGIGTCCSSGGRLCQWHYCYEAEWYKHIALTELGQLTTKVKYDQISWQIQKCQLQLCVLLKQMPRPYRGYLESWSMSMNVRSRVKREKWSKQFLGCERGCEGQNDSTSSFYKAPSVRLASSVTMLLGSRRCWQTTPWKRWREEKINEEGWSVSGKEGRSAGDECPCVFFEVVGSWPDKIRG